MDKQIIFEGNKIAYCVYGHGKTVMLVHGFGETGDVWKNQVAFLKDKFHLIIPDLPGSGRSEMINDMSMEGMAEVLKAILDKEIDSDQKETSKLSGPSKTSPFRGGLVGLIGHSMGGYITLAFVEKYGGLLDSFGLFHSTAYADTEEKKAARRKGIEFIKEHGAFEFLKMSTPNLFSPLSKDEIPGLIDQFIGELNNFSPESLVSYYESMISRPDRSAILKKTTMPVLFVMGKYDNAVPIQDGLRQCSLPENSYIHVLHQSGHMGMLEETDKTNRLLEDFFS
jgi:pimeloyl-ACP methyl ester carboxylesterase